MYKRGFTLAEMLITIAIIGFVSALTIPGLVQNAADAEIEPKIRKTQSAIVQASKNFLYDSGVDRIIETDIFGSDGTSILNTQAHVANLCNYLKCSSSYSSQGLVYFNLSDGVSIAFDSRTYRTDATGNPPHKFFVGRFYVDINGRSAPNETNKDIFQFSAYDDGSIRRLN